VHRSARQALRHHAGVPARWLVDGMNVIGSRPDGWWRDRGGAITALAASLEAFARQTGDEVAVVFDGRPVALGQEQDGAVSCLFAPSADDAIAERAAEDPEPASLTVVTSDAELAGRVRAHGARVTGAGAFRRRLDGSTSG
jgi:predicted RNA-binding protein with PIN domain